jgi:thiosulfate/3-mercaptopyruvate sulfurtransferase
VDVLVTAAALSEPGVVVIDCRWKLGEPGFGERAWRESRIPGARYLDVDTDMSAPPGARGRHPLPDAASFQAAARRAGVDDASVIVAYDQAGEGGAARCWWLFRHFGHDRVAILDGGFAGYDGPVDTSAPRPREPGDFSARERDDDTVSFADVVSPGTSRLIDARAAERYRGEVEPIDPVAGHIPGAENVPFATLMNAGRFAAPADLRAAIGPTGDAIAYCGSGISACVLIAAAAAAGEPLPRLYPGSWSEWSQTIAASRGGNR